MFVFGKNVAEEVLNSDKKIDKIFIQDNFKDESILKLINKRRVEVKKLNKFELSD